ncbi:RNase adapter RapZ [bacterium]|nr:RNase adapter RapZ [bacterium]
MQLIIITGLSGAGKTQCMHFLEDMGYFCADNIPPTLLPALLRMCHSAGGFEKVAAVVDARGGEFLGELLDTIQKEKNKGVDVTLIFLDASDWVLINRFKETRRKHPLLQQGNTISQAIREERKRLENIKQAADLVIDTSQLRPAQLKERLIEYFREGLAPLTITIISFGYQRGIPLEADLLLDVRFLPNPYYEAELKDLNGKDERVKLFVLRNEITQNFLKYVSDFLHFTLPLYTKEGKAHLTIGIGCTGGRHRSVVISEELGRTLRNEGYKVVVFHRDIDGGVENEKTD